MRRFIVSVVILAAIVGITTTALAAVPLSQKLAGRVLNQVQNHGALWYLSPVNHQRYYLGDATNAAKVLRKVSLAVSADNLTAIPVAGTTDQGNPTLRTRLSGRIVRLAGDTALWFISPLNRQRYLLDDQLLNTLRKLGLGISDANLKTIPVAAGYDAPKVPPKPVNGLLRVQKSIATTRGTFTVDLITLDTSISTYKLMTDTAQTKDCKNGCLTLSLGTYLSRRKAVMAMHGSYFCPREYASCVGQTGSYYYPVLNSFSRVLVNSDRVKYTNEPLITFDGTNAPTYYHHAKDILGKDTFGAVQLTNIRAAISNGPALIEAGKNVANPATMDNKQRSVKSYRGAIGWKGKTIYLYIVRGATVTDSAAVAQALGLDYAINLDGGGSTAMMDHGSYVLGPGRNLPNAILITP